MKKILGIFCAVVVIVCSLIGCGKSDNDLYAGEWKGQVGQSVESIVLDKDGTGYVQSGTNLYEFTWRISEKDQITVTNPENGEELNASIKEIDGKTVLVIKNIMYYRAEDFVDDSVSEDNDDSDYSEPVSEDDSDKISTVEWRDFLAEYEAIVDEYIAITEEYNKNPDDLDIASKYLDLTEEVTEWFGKTADVQLDLTDNPEDLNEYLKEVDRIFQKLDEAMQ